MIVRRGPWRFLLMTGACLVAGALTVAAAPPTASLRDAMEEAVRTLLADLFAERPLGRVVSVQGRDLIASFTGAVPPTDAEYQVVRSPASEGGGFAQTVGAARIAEVEGGTARAVVLWGEGDLQPGDRLAWPSRITIVLLPTQASDSPELAIRGRQLDRWLELQLLLDRRLRVVRADQPVEERWRLQRLQEEREYALTVAPLLLPEDDGTAVVLRVRSMFTGQTLAQRRAVWASAVPKAPPPPAPAPVAPPSPAYGAAIRAVAPPAPAPAPVAPAAPYGAAIRPVPSPAIQKAERNPDYLNVTLPHPVNAIALGDVDGDGRPEVIGITDRQVIVYRWSGRDLTPIATGDLLPVFTTYLSVDAADLNGNGKDEIVLTAVRSLPRQNRIENSVLSVIAEVSNGRIEPLATDIDQHLRVLKRPGERPLLLTQAAGLYEAFEGPVRVLEWKDGRYQLGARFPLPRTVASVYGFASGDLRGGGRTDLARVAPDGRLQVVDGQGQVQWESDDDLGEVDAPGFAQTPRHPDYRGRSFDATAEQLAVWRSVPRRVLTASPPGQAPDLVTIGNPRVVGFRLGARRLDDSARGRAFGYGWDADARRLVKRWESSDLNGQALDLAIGDLGGDGRVKLIVLSGGREKRSLDIFSLYSR